MSRRLVAPLVLLLVVGCARTYDNPFAASNQTMAAPADAELQFVSVASGGVPDRRDLFATDESGTPVTRLTACNRESRPCDVLEVSFEPGRSRIMSRRRAQDVNGDGRLTSADGESLAFVDLTRGTEAELIAPAQHVSGVDWSPQGGAIVYSALGAGGQEDLFVMDPNGANNRNLTNSAGVSERRARIDPTGSVAVYERIDQTGKGRIYIFINEGQQLPLTTGGTGSEALAGTPYVLGSDADPDYAPDGRTVVFRRLTGLGNGGLGTWDIMSVRVDGTDLRVLDSGPIYRGAPDWGGRGITYVETDAAAGVSRLVMLGTDGTRRVTLTVPMSQGLQYPRWLP